MNHKRKKPRTKSTSKGQFPCGTPAHWNILFHARPRRRRNRKILLRKTLWHKGYRYSFKGKLPGRPDIVLKKYKVAIFVDGCFWHRCPKHFKAPASNNVFWKDKIDGNVARDKRNNKALKKTGWRILRFWEHDVMERLPYIVNKIIRVTKKQQ